MRKIISILIFILVNVEMSGQVSNQDIFINLAIQGRTFEGIGALSAGASSRLLPDYPEKEKQIILDYLFKPQFGASLHHLKVEIPGDINSTCGTEPSHRHLRNDLNGNRGYEWWLMKEAKKRNPDIYLDALEWGVPFWIGNGQFFSQDNAEYIADFLELGKQQHGLDINYVGIWNEIGYDVEWIKLLRNTLNQRNLHAVKIVAADEIEKWTIVDQMEGNAELYDAVSHVGTHYPKYKSSSSAKSIGKSLWSSEDGPWRGDWTGAKEIIKQYNRNYIEGKMTKTIIWSLITSYSDILPLPSSGLMKANEPWSGFYETQPALWVTAHYTQFTQPGWKYLEGKALGYLDKGGSYVTLVSPDLNDISVVFETIDARERQHIEINLPGKYANKEFCVWTTDSIHSFTKANSIKPVKDKLIFVLEPGTVYTLSTTTGQKKGNENSPVSVPVRKKFPLPYKDNFASYQVGELPRYTMDQAGVFEIVEKNNQKVLAQVVPQIGVEWPSHVNPYPYTIIGDMDLKDYSISMDVWLEQPENMAYLYGRVNKVYQNTTTYPLSYYVKWDGKGNWALCKQLNALQWGKLEYGEKWREIMPLFSQTKNALRFDYQQIKQFPDSVMKHLPGIVETVATTKNPESLYFEIIRWGNYELHQEVVLAQGQVDYQARCWNGAKLEMKGDKIIFYLNGKKLAQIKDMSYEKGLAGWGTGWNTACFSNLKIERK